MLIRKVKRKSLILQIVTLLLCALLLVGCTVFDTDPSSAESQAGQKETTNTILDVHFFDVGQGDSTLLITHDGKTVLIDAGPNAQQERLLNYLETLKIKQIDYLILTHPHEDHIGGADAVIQSYPVGTILMPNATSNSSAFEKLLTVMEQKGMGITIVQPGDIYSLSDISISIYGPIECPQDDANNASIVLRIMHRNTSFLFSGDAEEDSEEAVLNTYGNQLKSNVYQVGHHGSSTSSHEKFVTAIDPEIAVISCGENNKYGHPHFETLDLFYTLKIRVLRTDLEGSIHLQSDGERVK